MVQIGSAIPTANMATSSADCNNRFYHFIHLADMLLDQTEDNGDDDKEHGDGSSGGVCVGGLGSHAVHAFSDETYRQPCP